MPEPPQVVRTRAALTRYLASLDEQFFLERQQLEDEASLWHQLYGPNSTLAGVEREIRLQTTELRAEMMRVRAEVAKTRAALDVELAILAVLDPANLPADPLAALPADPI